MSGRIYVGIGGWTYEPWRGVFYPPRHPQKRELEYAGRQLATIEINGTFYGSQKPESFRKWYGETPADFMFSVKGPRFATMRGVLQEGVAVGLLSPDPAPAVTVPKAADVSADAPSFRGDRGMLATWRRARGRCTRAARTRSPS